MNRQRFLAILDTMWGFGGKAPRWFHINPCNASGRRLYRLTGVSERELLVTNACPQQTKHATRHGVPDARWLFQSLSNVPSAFRTAPLLVCGVVATATYCTLVEHDGFEWDGPVLYLKHPAARTWTKAEIARVARRIQRIS